MGAIRWTAALLVVGLAGCSDETPPPAPIQTAPAVAFDRPTGRLAVAPITVDLPPRRGIGTYYRNVDCWVRVRSIMPDEVPAGDSLTAEVLKNLQAAKLQATLAPSADVGGAGDADYLLVGTVPSAHADLCIDNFFNKGPADIDAQVTIAWKLWSVRNKQVVYETTATGAAKVSDPNQTIETGVMAAVDDATRHLLATTATQQYLTYGHVIEAAPPPTASGKPAAPVPAGGTAPIPEPPPAIAAAIGPSAPVALPPILIPVKAARPAGAALDKQAALQATLTLDRNGAALALGDGYLLTAAANVGDAPAIGVTFGGKASSARIIRADTALGVALLRVDDTLPASLPLQPRRNAVGDKVFGVGPNGVVAGSFTATRAAGGRDTVKLDGAAVGGPVLDPAGNVIGVLLPDGGFASLGTVFRALQLGAQIEEE